MTTLLLSVLVLASGAKPAAAPNAKPAEPVIEMSVPAPCSDVWKDVYEGASESWKVTVLAPRQEDEKVPSVEALESWLASVPGLAESVSSYDALDRDMLYIRVNTQPLASLAKKYPKLDPKVLRAAKVAACRAAAAK